MFSNAIFSWVIKPQDSSYMEIKTNKCKMLCEKGVCEYICKKYRLMSACAARAGLHKSILFAIFQNFPPGKEKIYVTIQSIAFQNRFYGDIFM